MLPLARGARQAGNKLNMALKSLQCVLSWDYDETPSARYLAL